MITRAPAVAVLVKSRACAKLLACSNAARLFERMAFRSLVRPARSGRRRVTPREEGARLSERPDVPAPPWGGRLREWRGPLYWGQAALCSPAIVMILAVGYAIGRPLSAIVAAGTALSVGFGAARTFRRKRFAAMALAMLATVIAAVVGSLAANHAWLYLTCCAIFAAVVVERSARDLELWWILLQAAIAFFVAGYFPGDLHDAYARALIIGFGGTCQIAMVMALERLFPALVEAMPDQGATISVASRAAFSAAIARAAFGAPLALVLATSLGLRNSYWAPMTALLVLRPTLTDTEQRAVSRLIGTLAGCLCASGVAIFASNSPWIMIPAIGATAAAAFAFQKTQYGLMTFALTCPIVMLLDLGQGAPEANAVHRLLATALGGVVALVLVSVGPHDPPRAVGGDGPAATNEPAPR